MAPILIGVILLGAQHASCARQELVNNPSAREALSNDQAAREASNNMAREPLSMSIGLESGPSDQAWVHTHWYQQQPSKTKAEARRRTQRFAQLSNWHPLTRLSNWHPLTPPARSPRSRREKRSTRRIFRERRHSGTDKGTALDPGPGTETSTGTGTGTGTQRIFRERRHARFGGRAGLGLHWARDQFGHKLLMDR